MPDLPLDIDEDLTGIALVPASVQVLGCYTKLDYEIAREVLRLDLAPLFPPEAEEGGFIIANLRLRRRTHRRERRLPRGTPPKAAAETELGRERLELAATERTTRAKLTNGATPALSVRLLEPV